MPTIVDHLTFARQISGFVANAHSDKSGSISLERSLTPESHMEVGCRPTKLRQQGHPKSLPYQQPSHESYPLHPAPVQAPVTLSQELSVNNYNNDYNPNTNNNNNNDNDNDNDNNDDNDNDNDNNKITIIIILIQGVPNGFFSKSSAREYAKFYLPVYMPCNALCDGHNMAEQRFSFINNH